MVSLLEDLSHCQSISSQPEPIHTKIIGYWYTVMLKSYSYFCSLLQKDVLSSCTFNHYKCCCKKTKNTSQRWIKIYFTNKYILSLREEANVTGAVLYPVETTYTGIFPSRSMNGAGCARPPHQPAPAQVCTCWAHIRGCSEPQLRPLLFDCRELKGAKKEVLQ